MSSREILGSILFLALLVPAPAVGQVSIDGEHVYVFEGGVLRRVRRDDGEPAGELRLGGGSNSNEDGPSRHRILSATSPDGLTWTAGEVLVEPGSVPDAVVGPDGRVRVYFVDPPGITVGIETAPGRWGFESTNLRGADPNVLVLEDGTYRAYTKEGVTRGRFVVADSDDGVTFGRPRTVFEDDRYANVTDSDVFPTPGGWVLYASLGPKLLLAESEDGLDFRAVRQIDLGGSVCDTVAVEGGWRMYFHRNPSGSERMTIWSAFSADGREWKVEGLRLRGRKGGLDALGVGDPAVIRSADGSWRMFYKSFIPSSGAR